VANVALQNWLVSAVSAVNRFAGACHQQYLDKNPNGYCPNNSTGVSCPVGVLKKSSVDRDEVEGLAARFALCLRNQA